MTCVSKSRKSRQPKFLWKMAAISSHLPPDTDQKVFFNPTSEVESADYADYADKQKLGGETGRMSPKPAP